MIEDFPEDTIQRLPFPLPYLHRALVGECTAATISTDGDSYPILVTHCGPRSRFLRAIAPQSVACRLLGGEVGVEGGVDVN